MRKSSALLATVTALAALATATSANAAVTIDINQVGANVVAAANGTFDTTGLTPAASRPVTATIIPFTAVIEFGGGGIQGFVGLLGPSSFGTGGPTGASTTSGDNFGLIGLVGLIVVPSGYTGGLLSSTDTFANATIQSLGLTPGQYVYTAPNDTITVNIGGTGAVPEPATWAMMLLGFGGIGLALRRRRPASLASA